MRISVFLVMVHKVIGDGEVQGGCGREVAAGGSKTKSRSSEQGRQARLARFNKFQPHWETLFLDWDFSTSASFF
jgi:hypothetical protein